MASICSYMLCSLIPVLGLGPASGGEKPPTAGGVQAKRHTPKVEAVQQHWVGPVVEVGKDFITLRPESGGKPQRFAASAVLARGDYPREQTPGYRYKLSDVRVGDVVAIEYSRIDGVDICEAVNVGRRPGGLVPPGNYPANSPDQPHKRAQAMQEREEKGLPLPPDLHPQSPGPRRDLAPMPREAMPRSTPAAP